MKKNKYVIIPILLMLSALIIIIGFQNCGEMKTLSSEGTFGSGTDIPSDPIDPGNPGNPPPPSNLRTQDFTLSSLQTVDSSKILMVVDFEHFPNSASITLMAAKISELLQMLKGKHVQLAIISTGVRNSMSQYTYGVRADGGATIDLTQPLPNLASINYAPTYDKSNYNMAYSNPIWTPADEVTLAPLLGREIYMTHNSIVLPELAISITPSTTDSQLAAFASQIQTYLTTNNPNQYDEDGICVMSRFFGDDRSNSFLKPTDAVSALVISDVDDASSISSDCLKQADFIRKVVRIRKFAGQEKVAKREYYHLSPTTGEYSTYLLTSYVSAVSNWVDGAACSPADLATVDSANNGRTFKCTYTTQPITLLDSSLANYSEEDLCVKGFSVTTTPTDTVDPGGNPTPVTTNYLNALDYYRRRYPSRSILDSCTAGSFNHTTSRQTGITKEAKYYFITDINALQTQNAVLGFSEIVKKRFSGTTPISSIVHIPNESCTLPYSHSYGTKYLNLATYLGSNAFSTSICGNGYTEAFTRSANTSGGSQQKTSLTLTRNNNEVVYAILLVLSDGQTVKLPASSYTFEGSTVTILSPLLKVGMKVVVQYRPY